MASTNAAPVYGDISPLPSGLKTFSTFPDLLMILEFVFGGLVWILIASTRLPGTSLLQGWVMFVSICCFIFTTILMLLYCIGAHGGKSTWTTIDALYHFTAALFYLSASVLQAYLTILVADLVFFNWYQENIAAVVFAYIATLLYVIHALASLFRWKRSP
ncbi:PREDICTED: myelin and lymphocyte protein-like [Nanorana parkeri]|uniref:myelin and lymphocyte protein-like n=1 Tax=Nanorana parkeri TaxID=125878 RepID=UPI00085469DD|nr:PREDICTED: myelin and lymphocyte protein-like [Nanorana parkeri]